MEAGSHAETETFERGVIESAMHIIDGLISRPNDVEDVLARWGKGCVELYDEMIQYAAECHRLFKEGYAKYEEGAGVFDYEVSCEFGTWYGQNLPTHDEAMKKLQELNDAFWKQ